MQSFGALGRWLVILGGVIIVIGGIIWLLGRIPGINKLPGTLTFTLGGVTFVIPILASLVLSVVLTFVLNLVIQILRHINR